MEVEAADPLVAAILTDPDGARARVELDRLRVTSPAESAALLERLAASVEDQPARASRWLTEAAALWSGAAGDPKRAARALRAAIEISPGDDHALARLTELYCENGKHRALARILERRAEALRTQAGSDPEGLRRAAQAFTALGHLLRDEPVASPVDAIEAYNRAIATGVAPPETYRAARALYLEAEQSADALPLFAAERARGAEPERVVALCREEAQVRKLAGDTAGASAVLQLAHRLAPEVPGLGEELARSILDRLDADELVVAEEAREAAEIFVSLASGGAPGDPPGEPLGGPLGENDGWREAERCFAGAQRWEDAAWAAERRGAWVDALELLGHAGHAAAVEPEDRLRIALREAHLVAVGLGDAQRAARCYASLLEALPPGADAALIERLVRTERSDAGSPVDVATRLETAALEVRDLGALKLAFALSARAHQGVARAAELVRQAEVLVGLGADRPLALRHAEAGLADLAVAEAAPLVERLAGLAGPDEAIDLYERVVARGAPPADRVAAIELGARAAVKRASTARLSRFFETVSVHCTDEPALAALERAAADGDRKRGGSVIRGLLAAALAKAEPDVLDGGRTRSGFLRRAARIARRDLGDADQAFEWLGDALFARLEGALEDALAPLENHADALRRTETIARELHALLERDGGRLPTRPPTVPPPPPVPRAPAPSRPPTIPPPVPTSAAPAKPPSVPPAIPRAAAPPRPPSIPPPAIPRAPRPPSIPPPPIARAPAPALWPSAPPAPPPPQAIPRPAKLPTTPPAPRPSMEVSDPFPTSLRARGSALKAAVPAHPGDRPGAVPAHPGDRPGAVPAHSGDRPGALPDGGPAPRPPTLELVAEPPRPSPPSPVRLPPPPVAANGEPAALKPPGSQPPKSRSSGDELIADLFEAMHVLDFCKDSNEAAAFTLKLAMEKLGSDAGIVHLYDIDGREFVVVHAAAPGAPALIGLRTADTNLLAAEAMRTRGALIVPTGAADPRAAGERWEALRAATGEPVACIACARAAQAGRFLGLIELANLAGTGAFAAGDEHALTYIAERFTEFVADHGVLLGDDGGS